MLKDAKKLERFGRKSTELSQKYSIETQVQSLEALYIESVLQHWRGKHNIRQQIGSLVEDGERKFTSFVEGGERRLKKLRRQGASQISSLRKRVGLKKKK